MSYEQKCLLQAITGQPLPTEELSLIPGGEDSPPLDLVSVSNSHNSDSESSNDKCDRKARGTGGLTSYGKRMVRNAAELMEKKYGAERLSFLTLTLPDMEAGLREKANIEWAEMMRQFLQWLSRRLCSSGLPSLIVGVSEIQPKRAESSGHRWLHYHAVFLGRKIKSSWAIKPQEIRKAWTNIVRKRVVGFEGECPGENIKRVQGGAGQYLSKYMTKGSEIEGTGVLPSAWWNASKPLREEVKRQIRTGDSTAEWLQMLVDEHLDEPGQAFYWLRPVTLMGEDGTGFLIGWTGKIRPGSFP